MFKKTLIASLLAAAGVSAFAADYYVVVPLPAKQHLLDGISVALSSTSLPTGLVGVPYVGFDLGQALLVTGDPAYSSPNVGWSVVAGVLPAGLALNKGVLSGTPTTAGAQSFSVRATYKTKTGEQAYQILTFAVTVSLATGTLPQGVMGVAYPAYDLKPLLTVSGDPSFNPANVTWSVVTSTLPAGLTLTADGTLSGTPTASGAGTLVARASYKGANGEQTYQVVTLGITVSLATATLPSAIVGQAYSYDAKPLLSVTGDPAYSASSVTWSIVYGALPAGLAVNVATGVISGTPTAGRSGLVMLNASYRGVNGNQTYEVVALNLTVSLVAATLPIPRVSTAYSYDFKPTLLVTGDPAYSASNVTWSVPYGALPAGLALNAATGVISGTPTTVNGYNFAVRAGYKNVYGLQNYTLNVTP